MPKYLCDDKVIDHCIKSQFIFIMPFIISKCHTVQNRENELLAELTKMRLFNIF